MRELKRWIAVLFGKCKHPTFKIVVSGTHMNIHGKMRMNDMLECNYCKEVGRSSCPDKEYIIKWEDEEGG